MKTFPEMVKEVVDGARRVDADICLDKLYEVKCYKVGNIIRIDLKPVEPICSPQEPSLG